MIRRPPRSTLFHLAILAHLTVHRSDIDDAAPAALAHARKGRLGHVETTAQIGVHHLFPILIAHLHAGAIAGDAGVIDDDVDRAEILFDLGNPGVAGIIIGDVPFIALDPRT